MKILMAMAAMVFVVLSGASCTGWDTDEQCGFPVPGDDVHAEEVESSCVPECDECECGEDNCGGSYGICSSNTECVDNTCLSDLVINCKAMYCQSHCEENQQCGHDDCFGTCGECLNDGSGSCNYGYCAGSPISHPPENMPVLTPCMTDKCVGFRGIAAEVYQTNVYWSYNEDNHRTYQLRFDNPYFINTECGVSQEFPQDPSSVFIDLDVDMVSGTYGVYLLLVRVQKVYDYPDGVTLLTGPAATVGVRYFRKVLMPDFITYNNGCLSGPAYSGGWDYKSDEFMQYDDDEAFTPLGNGCLHITKPGDYIIRLTYAE